MFVCTDAATALAAPFDHAQLAERARTGFIVPGYARLSTRLQHLDIATAKLCASPGRATLSGMRAAYRDTIAAWGEIEIVAFGPVAEGNRFERIFFWPDRRGIGERQIRRLLASQDRNSLVAERLAEKSVAVQGLTALEMLVYGDDADKLASNGGDPFRCNYARAIIANVSGMVDAIRNDWRDGGRFAESWRKPGRGNRTYITSKETTLELVKAFDQGLENLRDRRIAPAIGLGPTRRQMRPVLWRSKLSIVLFKANMVAAQKLLTSGGLAQAYVLARDNSEEARGDMSSLTSEFRITIAAVDKLARMSDAFARPDTRGRLVALGAPLKNIKVRTVGLLKDAAGLSIGFNASDGD